MPTESYRGVEIKPALISS